MDSCDPGINGAQIRSVEQQIKPLAARKRALLCADFEEQGCSNAATPRMARSGLCVKKAANAHLYFAIPYLRSKISCLEFNIPYSDMNMTDIRPKISHLCFKIRHIHAEMRPIAIKMANIHIEMAPIDSKIMDLVCAHATTTSNRSSGKNESPSITICEGRVDPHITLI